jgi:hypothetical protein
MYDRMIQAEIDYRRDRFQATPAQRRRLARTRVPFVGAARSNPATSRGRAR